MGLIMKMNSKTFINKFLKEYDPQDFQFLLVSENITSNGEHKNVMGLKALIPPVNIASIFVNEGTSKDYKKKYLDYIKKDNIRSLITIIVNAAVIQNLNVVLICSKSEDEFGYLDMICEFIEAEYKLKTYSFKKFHKDPEKAMQIDNREKVSNILFKQMEKLKESGISLDSKVDPEKLQKKLQKLDKDELLKYCKYKNIKVDKDDGKKKIIKKIIKRLT